MPKETHKSHTLGNGTTGRKTKSNDCLSLSRTPSADNAPVCCWSTSASAKPAVSLPNLSLPSFQTGGTGAAKVTLVPRARRTTSCQLNRYPRTEEQKQARGTEDRFQAADLRAATWAVPSAARHVRVGSDHRST